MRQLLLAAALTAVAAPAFAQVFERPGYIIEEPEITGSIIDGPAFERDPRIDNSPFPGTNPAAEGNAEMQTRPSKSYGGVAGGPAARFE